MPADNEDPKYIHEYRYGDDGRCLDITPLFFPEHPLQKTDVKDRRFIDSSEKEKEV